MSAPWQLSAVELVERYRERSLTPEEALESVLIRIAQHNPLLNAIIALDSAGARQAARASTARYVRGEPLSPLDGVPLTIKDNLEVALLPCTWGSRLFADHIPKADELPVARLRAGGAVILGKTNCSEFAMVGHTDNLLFGTTRNPWDPTLTVGGSSGGSVSAVAAGFGPISLGTDGGGSTRRPAAHTGLVGLKPSRGRLARAGGLPAIFLDYEVVGPIARTVEDVLLVAQALAEPHATDPSSWAFSSGVIDVPHDPERLNILYIDQFGNAPLDPEISSLIGEAATRLERLGHRVEHARHWGAAEAVNEHWMRLAQSGLARHLAAHNADLSILTQAAQQSAQIGQNLAATDLFSLFEAVNAMNRKLGELFERYDVLLTPTTASWPWPIDQVYPSVIDGQPVGPRGHAVFTAFVNAAGLPAISLPCGRSAGGSPNGMQLVAPWGHDGQLIALARQWERASPWRQDWPLNLA
jgi:aspartyl-tRNA(Asn)/glutamyl-tRNA(Gln) amidotransferase subunit A